MEIGASGAGYTRRYGQAEYSPPRLASHSTLYRSPLLCRIYKVCAFIAAAAALIVLVVGLIGSIGVGLPAMLAALWAAVGSGLAALGLFAVAEVVDLIGKSAYHAKRTADAAEASHAEICRLGKEEKGQPGAVQNADPILDQIARDLKGLRGQLDNIEAGPLTYLQWLPYLGQAKEGDGEAPKG